jgi:hypothetical protein
MIAHIIGWFCVYAAIFTFVIVMRDLLLMHAERVAAEKEREKLVRDAEVDEAAENYLAQRDEIRAEERKLRRYDRT